MRNPWLALRAGADPRERTRQMGAAHDAFLAGAGTAVDTDTESDSDSVVRGVVADSWRRSAAANWTPTPPRPWTWIPWRTTGPPTRCGTRCRSFGTCSAASPSRRGRGRQSLPDGAPDRNAGPGRYRGAAVERRADDDHVRIGRSAG